MSLNSKTGSPNCSPWWNKALKGFPATIRFLDPPLHEFLPHEDTAQNDLA